MTTLEQVGGMIREAVARERARITKYERLCLEARARQDAKDAETDRAWEARALNIWRSHGGRYSLDEIRKDLGIIP